MWICGERFLTNARTTNTSSGGRTRSTRRAEPLRSCWTRTASKKSPQRYRQCWCNCRRCREARGLAAGRGEPADRTQEEEGEHASAEGVERDVPCGRGAPGQKRLMKFVEAGYQ